MNAASEVRTLRRLAESRGLRVSKRGEDFYLIDADTNAIVLGWGLSGGVHVDEVKAHLRPSLDGERPSASFSERQGGPIPSTSGDQTLTA
jgi:hypothetical protein